MNYVALRFYQPVDLVGTAVYWLQRSKGLAHPQLVHVTLTLQSGWVIDRIWGKTTIAIVPQPEHGYAVDLLVPTKYSDDVIVNSSHIIYGSVGDMQLGSYVSCSQFVASVLGHCNLPSRYPSQYYDSARRIQATDYRASNHASSSTDTSPPN